MFELSNPGLIDKVLKLFDKAASLGQFDWKTSIVRQAALMVEKNRNESNLKDLQVKKEGLSGTILTVDPADRTGLALVVITSHISNLPVVLLVKDKGAKEELFNAIPYLNEDNMIPINGDLEEALLTAIARLKEINENINSVNYYSEEHADRGIKEIAGTTVTMHPISQITAKEQLSEMLELMGVDVTGNQTTDTKFKVFQMAQAVAKCV